MDDLDEKVSEAVRIFWETRSAQREQQEADDADRGLRSAVTGGKQMDGFASLLTGLLVNEGVPQECIHYNRSAEIPGYFRASKQWDLIVVVDDQLLAAIELKSQVGPSFGNNFNNRTEEALGNSTDLHTAYREGAFEPSPRPWIGYLMLLEESEGSTSEVTVREPHFPAMEVFPGTSYADRYEILCKRLVREELYDAAAFLTSTKGSGLDGGYSEPNSELSVRTFAASLLGHISGQLRISD